MPGAGSPFEQPPPEGRTLTADELAARSGVPGDRLDWLVGIGILGPGDAGRFSSGDAFRVTLVEALLKAGFTAEQIEQAQNEGVLRLEQLHLYYLEPPQRSTRSFAEFAAAVPAGGAAVPGIYAVLGLAEPEPSDPLAADEEELVEAFLAGWTVAGGDEVLMRAARLIGEGVRLAAGGWFDLFAEQTTPETLERVRAGDPGLEEHLLRLTRAGTLLAQLAPRMMVWLAQRYLEQSFAAATVAQFEEFMAARGLLPPPPPPGPPPAIAFVDLSGFTRLTQELGDEAAARSAASLREQAEAAARKEGGRLVKLLGDGAMLHFRHPRPAVLASLELVRSVRRTLGLSAHAGIHAGRVIERDRDVFGTTVNLASRIAGVAGPGEVVVSELVAEHARGHDLSVEKTGDAVLKGVVDPVPLFRVQEVVSEG